MISHKCGLAYKAVVLKDWCCRQHLLLVVLKVASNLTKTLHLPLQQNDINKK